MSQLLFCFCF